MLKMPTLANVGATFLSVSLILCYHERVPRAEHASHAPLLDFNRHQSSDIIHCRNSPVNRQKDRQTGHISRGETGIL